MANHSSSTRAIVAAFNDRYELCGPFDDNWQELCLAAALRAASTTLTNARAADALRANAAELEGEMSTSSTHYNSGQVSMDLLHTQQLSIVIQGKHGASIYQCIREAIALSASEGVNVILIHNEQEHKVTFNELLATVQQPS